MIKNKSHLKHPDIRTMFNLLAFGFELIYSDSFLFCKLICQLPDVIFFVNQWIVFLIIFNNILKKSSHSLLFIIIKLIRTHPEFSFEEYMPIVFNKFTKFLTILSILFEKLIQLRLILWQMINIDFLLAVYELIYFLIFLIFLSFLVFYLLLLSVFTFLRVLLLCSCFVIHIDLLLIFWFFLKLSIIFKKFLL